MITRLRWPSAMGMWTVDSFPMCGAHLKPLDLEKLWDTLTIRGDNEEIPGRDGKLDREHFLDEAVVQLQYQIAGGYDSAGTPWSSNIIGLAGNYQDLKELSRPPGSGNTRTSVLVKPDGTTLTAEVQLQVSDLVKEGGGYGRTVVTVIIPEGEHILGGS